VNKITVENLIILLQSYPSDMVVSAYVESIDSVVELTGVEEHDGELNIRIDY
jgi:hypothetical protein